MMAFTATESFGQCLRDLDNLGRYAVKNEVLVIISCVVSCLSLLWAVGEEAV